MILHDRHHAWEALVADPATVGPSAAAGTLRYFPSAPAVLRMASEDAECGGVTVPANSLAAASLDAVCRDPALFDQPDQFDLARDRGRTYAFGAGAHYCLGANLALLVIEVAVRTSRLAVPGTRTRLAIGGPPVDRRPLPGTRLRPGGARALGHVNLTPQVRSRT